MTALTHAERILKSLGIEAPGEIDLEAIAWTRGAVVDYRPLDRCEATIVGSKRKAVIAVNSRSPPERRRFSLAHELGHWHHHKGRMLFCGGRDVCNFANGSARSGAASRCLRVRSHSAELAAWSPIAQDQAPDACGREGDCRGVFGEPDGDAL
jgi:hypothetical protein